METITFLISCLYFMKVVRTWRWRTPSVNFLCSASNRSTSRQWLKKILQRWWWYNSHNKVNAAMWCVCINSKLTLFKYMASHLILTTYVYYYPHVYIVTAQGGAATTAVQRLWFKRNLWSPAVFPPLPQLHLKLLEIPVIMVSLARKKCLRMPVQALSSDCPNFCIKILKPHMA